MGYKKERGDENVDDDIGKIGISSQILIGSSGNQAKKARQYIAALAVTLGAVACGTLLSWTSPAKNKVLNGDLGFDVTSAEFDWISGLMPLGAACVCFPISLVMNAIGRKMTMLLLIIVFTIGWSLITWPTSVPMVFVGRFLGGVAGGSFCVSAPLYTSEIAEISIRGTLGSYFQLGITVGILIDYILGTYFDSVKIYSLVGLCIPFIFGLCFMFQPETPVYYLSKNQIEKARKSLKYFRGKEYDYNAELQQMLIDQETRKRNPVSFASSFAKTSTKKAIFICFALMFFQQMSGVNAIIFFMNTIFESSKNLPVSSATATIIVGVIQVLATFMGSIFVEKLGRKVLLLMSSFVMAACLIALGIFNYLDQSIQDNLSLMPIALIALFIIMFSVGLGPIPWMITAELIPNEAKSVAGSLACTLNWTLAFFVTMFFNKVVDAIKIQNAFLIFGVITIVGFLFVLGLVPETKGKTVDEMQEILSGKKNSKGQYNSEYTTKVVP